MVPVWIASSKLEYAARTIRPKIHRHLNNFLTDFPRLEPNHVTGDVTAEMLHADPIDWRHLDSTLEIDRRVKAVESIKPGTAAAFDVLHSFIRSRLHHFDTKRNDPNARHVSGMSPYLHFGQIAPQRCAFEVNKYRGVSRATMGGQETSQRYERALIWPPYMHLHLLIIPVSVWCSFSSTSVSALA